MKDFYKDFEGDVDIFINKYLFGDSVTNFPSDPPIFDNIVERFKSKRGSNIVWTGYMNPFTVIFIEDISRKIVVDTET